ncbi:hypothetical protein KQI65_05260 [bacterium]|nr:hypothetical protein [bacterium]
MNAFRILMVLLVCLLAASSLQAQTGTGQTVKEPNTMFELKVRVDGHSVIIRNDGDQNFRLTSIGILWQEGRGYWSKEPEDMHVPAHDSLRVQYADIVANYDPKTDDGYPRGVMMMLENEDGKIEPLAFIGNEVDGYQINPLLVREMKQRQER